jgi:hypothetical protein
VHVQRSLPNTNAALDGEGHGGGRHPKPQEDEQGIDVGQADPNPVKRTVLNLKHKNSLCNCGRFINELCKIGNEGFFKIN